MEFEKHGKVVEAIKASGDKVELLVVGEKADAHFKSCKVVPTSAHVTGPLPTIPAEGTCLSEICPSFHRLL